MKDVDKLIRRSVGYLGSITEIAKTLNVSRFCVYNWIWTNRIPMDKKVKLIKTIQEIRKKENEHWCKL